MAELYTFHVRFNREESNDYVTSLDGVFPLAAVLSASEHVLEFYVYSGGVQMSATDLRLERFTKWKDPD